VVVFADNRRLKDLCGEYDCNLAAIEQKLSVQILPRGNMFALLGPPAAVGAAARTLRALYARLGARQIIAPPDIDKEIRLARAAQAEGCTETARETTKAGVAAHHKGRPSSSFTKAGTTKAGVAAPARNRREAHQDLIEIRTARKPVEPRSPAQRAYMRNMLVHEMAFGIGPAGTGKTYLAVGVGVHLFLGGLVERIILCRPAVEAGEKLGYLPGDMKEKIDPYMQPLYDALHCFLPEKQLLRLIEDKRIEIAPLAFMRGRTLANAFVVLDEAQNTTEMQMKMFLTRFGPGSRMVITGDLTQVDLPPRAPSGLAQARALLADLEGISFNYFQAGDVVRHPLVAAIIQAYDAEKPHA